MNFRRVLDQGSGEFKEIWRIYLTSFPANQRRTLEGQIMLFGKRQYSLLAVYEGSQLAGFISEWGLDQFIFVEHFAVRESFRGKGFGTRILKEYLARKDKTVILESERPEYEEAKKRISFYGKAGFRLNSYDYSHPPYDGCEDSASLFLMSFPKEVDEYDLFEIQEILHKTVYCKEKERFLYSEEKCNGSLLAK